VPGIRDQRSGARGQGSEVRCQGSGGRGQKTVKKLNRHNSTLSHQSAGLYGLEAAHPAVRKLRDENLISGKWKN